MIFIKQTAAPKTTKNIPKYIGLRLKRKSPSVIKTFDSLKVSVVPPLLKLVQDQRANISPINTKNQPAKLYG